LGRTSGQTNDGRYTLALDIRTPSQSFDLTATPTAGGTITSVDTTVVGAVTTTIITYSDGTHATIVRTVNADGSVTIVTVDALNVRTVQNIANADGSLRTGGDERARQAARSGRISWRELVAP
jgi:hypothetical protein